MTTTPTRRQHYASRNPDIAPIDASVRWPVLACFFAGVHWLVTGTFLLVYAASLRHPQNGFPILDLFTTLSENFAAFTFGRVWATAFHCLVYGWAGNVGLGLTVWVVARLTRTVLKIPGVLMTGVAFWNLGIAAGLIAIFEGFGSGVELLEFPAWCDWTMLIAYVIFSYWAVTALANTPKDRHFISLPWLLVSLFSFPWLFGAAVVDLLPQTPGITLPEAGSGVAQGLVSAWFLHGLFTLWLGPIAIATLYYILSKVSSLPIHYYSWSPLAFWTWIFLAPWSAVHDMVGGPFPYWTVTFGLLLSGLNMIPVILISYSLITTCMQAEEVSKGRSIVVQFLTLGSIFFAVTGAAELLLSVRPLNVMLHFTIFREANMYMWIFGFFSFTAFGSMYYIVPRLMDFGWRSGEWIKVHYYASLYGILLLIVLMGFGGIFQGLSLENTDPLVNIQTTSTVTISYYISGTMCLALISLGNGVFIAHLGWMIVDRFRTIVRKDPTLSEFTFEPYETDEEPAMIEEPRALRTEAVEVKP